MKKKIFGGIAVVAIAVVVAFNVNLNLKKESKYSKLELNNLEALADFYWDGKEYNNSDTHWWGSNWSPIMTTCQVQIGIPPYVVVVDGYKVTCNHGNGNCLMASSCSNA